MLSRLDRIVRQKTVFFFAFEGVCRINTVNMNETSKYDESVHVQAKIEECERCNRGGG